jgi:hypothetical protein
MTYSTRPATPPVTATTAVLHHVVCTTFFLLANAAAARHGTQLLLEYVGGSLYKIDEYGPRAMCLIHRKLPCAGNPTIGCLI